MRGSPRRFRDREVWTGYFANIFRWTKVHLVENGKPLCGSRIGDDMAFQWCAGGAWYDYLECEKCKKIFIKERDEVDAIQAK